MAAVADIHETLRRVSPAIPADADRTLRETYDLGAYERARTSERLTIIAYEAARSADSRLRAWCELAPCERRLWRMRRAEILDNAARAVGHAVSDSEKHGRAWLVFGSITLALSRASATELACALSVFDAETRQARRGHDEAPSARKVAYIGDIAERETYTGVWNR